MSKPDILTRLAREAAEAYYPGRDEPRRTLLDAAILITSLREALDGVLAEADRDTRAFRRAREALREQS